MTVYVKRLNTQQRSILARADIEKAQWERHKEHKPGHWELMRFVELGDFADLDPCGSKYHERPFVLPVRCATFWESLERQLLKRGMGLRFDPETGHPEAYQRTVER